MEATLNSKNQVTIPKEVRELLHLSPGDKFRFFFQLAGRVVLLPVIPVSQRKGILPGGDRPLPVEQMNKAIGEGATQRFTR